MSDLYDILLKIVERLFPDGEEKHKLTERVKNLQEEHRSTAEKKVKNDGSNKQ